MVNSKIGITAEPQTTAMHTQCSCGKTFTKYIKSEIDELCRDWLILECHCGAQKGAVMAMAEDRRNMEYDNTMPVGIKLLLDSYW